MCKLRKQHKAFFNQQRDGEGGESRVEKPQPDLLHKCSEHYEQIWSITRQRRHKKAAHSCNHRELDQEDILHSEIRFNEYELYTEDRINVLVRCDEDVLISAKSSLGSLACKDLNVS